MNIEDLNKHQLLLLTILVSFVTSITTGILTVSLLQQAPTGVTTTINRVVEKTVEKVVPGEFRTVVKEVPVIVTEEELIVKAIDGAKASVFKIIDSQKADKAIASGFLVEPLGRVVSVMPDGFSAENGHYQLVDDNGSIYPLDVVKTNNDSGLVIYKIRADKLESFTKQEDKANALKISTRDQIVGQTVIGISASNSQHTVAVSIIGGGPNSTTTPDFIKTNAATPENLGGPLLDIHGEVVGVSTASGLGIAKEVLKSVIDSIK